jgi:putative transposase
MRHTTFRFALDPTPAQEQTLTRYAGASRFAYNQSLRLMTAALASRRTDPSVVVPRSRFDLINAFNAWKKTEDAGRIFVVAPDTTVTKVVTGLAWRHEVAAQVFEEAAVDLSRALAAYLQAKAGSPNGRHTGFPKLKRKGHCRESFRLRNKHAYGPTSSIRVGEGHPRCVTLPTIGSIRVHDDTRRLRRLLRPVVQLDTPSGQPVVRPRAKILFATVRRHGARWYVCLNVQAPDFHAGRCHQLGSSDHRVPFVGVDRGLATFAVAATSDGVEVGRFRAPRPLTVRLGRLRRRSRALSRTKPRSRNRATAIQRLSREHARIARIRENFLHEVSSHLAKTHGRLALEDLAVSNLVQNRHVARAIGDAAWAELGRQLRYKVEWRGGELIFCDRWFASTATCMRCGTVKRSMGLAERAYRCDRCRLAIDRDRNAATNLAAWAERYHVQAPDRQAGGRVNNALGGEGAGHRSADGETGPGELGTKAQVT